MYYLKKIYSKFETIICRTFYNKLKDRCHKVELPAPDQAQKELEKYRPIRNNRCGANNFIGEKKYDLTIIVPAYNVEKYIEQCLDSILTQQTKYSFIIKVVDDSSTDRTLEILNDKYKSLNNILIYHIKNEGPSSGRNEGLKELYSPYVYFIDADDMMLPGTIEKLLDKAYQYDLDIVEGGFHGFNETGILYTHTHKESIIYDNKQSAGLFGFPWNKVFKSECFKNLKFNEGYLFEDTIGIYIFYPLAKRIGLVSDITYGYRRNPKGIMQSLKNTTKGIDSYLITAQLLDDIEYYKLPVDKQYLYDITLSQIVTNYQRTKFLKDDIQKAIFVLSCELIEKYFSGYKATNDRLKDLEASIRARNFKLYKLVIDSGNVK